MCCRLFYLSAQEQLFSGTSIALDGIKPDTGVIDTKPLVSSHEKVAFLCQDAEVSTVDQDSWKIKLNHQAQTFCDFFH